MKNKFKKMSKLALYVAVNAITIGVAVAVVGGVLSGR